jgi:hypothetical protein
VSVSSRSAPASGPVRGVGARLSHLLLGHFNLDLWSTTRGPYNRDGHHVQEHSSNDTRCGTYNLHTASRGVCEPNK